MIHISPEFKLKINKFKRNKKSYYSLIILLALFLLSLPAELICNDKPILVILDGKWYFPILKTYTFADMGGPWNTPIVSYKSETFKNFIDGKTPVMNHRALLREKGYQDTPFIKYKSGEKHSFKAIYPLIPHSYKSFYTSKKLDLQRLVSPMEYEKGGKKMPGGVTEGHYLGTDKEGKDVLARLIYGFRLSLIFGLTLAFTSTLIGCILGAIQGYFGGIIDLGGQRLTEIWGAIPRLMLMMMLSDFLSRQGDFTPFAHLIMLFLILNLTSWMGMAAHMRAMFLRARNLDYVKAAKSLGVSNVKIMVRHILPNSLTPIVTFLPFAVSGGILALVGLDFLGFGIKYPAPSLGELLAQGQENLDAWWIIFPTFFTLSTLLVLLTFIGDGVRNAFDPRHKG